MIQENHTQVNTDQVIQELLEQNKQLSFQNTVMKVALQQAQNDMNRLAAENVALRDHIIAFENAAKAAAAHTHDDEAPHTHED